jgi:hypothetical protein
VALTINGARSARHIQSPVCHLGSPSRPKNHLASQANWTPTLWGKATNNLGAVRTEYQHTFLRELARALAPTLTPARRPQALVGAPSVPGLACQSDLPDGTD